MALTELSALDQGALPRLGFKTVEIETSASAGDQTLVAGVAGKRIIVWGMYFTAQANNTVRLYSGASSGGDALTGTLACFANLPVLLRFDDDIPVCWTEEGAALVGLTSVTGATAPIGGVLMYSEV